MKNLSHRAYPIVSVRIPPKEMIMVRHWLLMARRRNAIEITARGPTKVSLDPTVRIKHNNEPIMSPMNIFFLSSCERNIRIRKIKAIPKKNIPKGSSTER